MKYIKLVASDLDGTLLDKNKEITPRLYHALEQMNEQGIYFVPATGNQGTALSALCYHQQRRGDL